MHLTRVARRQVITNPNIKLEKFTEGARHFIAAADLNAPNAGSFFLRNSPLGRAFLDTMCAASPIYKLSGWFGARCRGNAD